MLSETECYYDYGNNTRLRIFYNIRVWVNVCSVWSCIRIAIY